MERFISIDKLDGRRVLLYGAGNNGKKIYRILEKYGISIYAFVDKKQETVLIDEKNCPVLSCNDIEKSDIVIITPEKESFRQEIEKTLESHRFNNYYYLDNNWRLYESIVNLYGDKNSKSIIDLEKEWRDIKNSVPTIKAHIMWASRVGEVSYRFLVMKRAFNDDVSFYNIVIPYCEPGVKVANASLMRIFARYINLVGQENAEIWRFVFLFHASEIDLSQMDYYDKYKEIDIHLDSDNYKKEIEFSDEELEIARKKWESLHIGKEYVCIHARDSFYLDNHVTSYKKGTFFYHNYRDFSVQDYDKLVDYLDKEEKFVIRVGNGSNTKYHRNNVLDFATEYYDELLDLYIISNCKYWIGTATGACYLGNLFGCKMIFINWPLLWFGAFVQKYEPDQIFSLKLYYDKNEDRILSIKEIIEKNMADLQVAMYEERYGIVLINNSPEEILQIYIEADKRYNGQWVDSEEEAKLQKKYEKMMEEFCNENPYCVFQGTKRKIEDCLMPIKISSSFLRLHPELVED